MRKKNMSIGLELARPVPNSQKLLGIDLATAKDCA